jgi:hypothetical protein
MFDTPMRSDLLATTQLSRVAQNLVALNLANGGDPDAIAEAVCRNFSLNRLLGRFYPGMTGLRGVLDKLDLAGVPPHLVRRTLRALLTMMGRENARRTLAHAETIDVRLLRILSVLPDALCTESIVRWLNGPLEAALLAALYKARVALSPEAAAVFVEQLRRSRSRPSLFAIIARATDDLRARRASFAADRRWRLIQDGDDVDEVAFALELCLRMERWRTLYLRKIESGAGLLAWWRTPSCSALVEIQPSLTGKGRAVQIKARANVSPPPIERRRICASLESMGFDCEAVGGRSTAAGGVPLLVEMIGILDDEGARRTAAAALRGLRGRPTRRRDVDRLWRTICRLDEVRRIA